MPDDRQQPRPGGDAVQALQNALVLHPPSEKAEPRILSINPSVWEAKRHIIDIGPLLHVRPTMPGREADLKHGVALDFQSAGWPLQRIAEEFRSNLKNPERIDVALLGEDGHCLVAVEVKRNTGPHWRRRVREAWEQLDNKASDVTWYCVTDGTTYLLRNTTTGAHFELQHPFSPETSVRLARSRPRCDGCWPASATLQNCTRNSCASAKTSLRS